MSVASVGATAAHPVAESVAPLPASPIAPIPRLLRERQASTLKVADADTIERFRNALTRQGIRCTLRTSRGEDIQAACGMLTGENP